MFQGESRHFGGLNNSYISKHTIEQFSFVVIFEAIYIAISLEESAVIFFL